MTYTRSKQSKNKNKMFDNTNEINYDKIFIDNEDNEENEDNQNNEIIDIKDTSFIEEVSNSSDEIIECNIEHFNIKNINFKKCNSCEDIPTTELNEKELNKCNKSDTLIENTYTCLEYSLELLTRTFKFFIRISGIYLLWICLHYFASHLYIRLCVPNNWYGFIISPFLTATPHCRGLRWIVYNGADIINNMWLVIGSWICSNILVLPREQQNND